MNTAMNSKSFAILLLGILPVLGQTVVTTPSPAIKFVPSSFFPPVGQNLIPAAPSVNGTRGGVVTNSALGQLNEALTNLEAEVRQALATIATFKDTFEFEDTTGVRGVATNPPANYGVLFSGDFSTNFGVNSSSALGQDLSQSLATPTGGTPPGTLAIGNGGRGLLVPMPAAATTVNAAAAAPENLPFTRDTLRALLVLQIDLDRALSELQALNSGTFSGTSATGRSPGP